MDISKYKTLRSSGEIHLNDKTLRELSKDGLKAVESMVLTAAKENPEFEFFSMEIPFGGVTVKWRRRA